MDKPALLDRLPTRALARRRLRVLVVEDNVDVAHTLAQLLRVVGHHAEVAYTGAAGLTAAKECLPDAVMCAIGLPELDGHQVARKLRRDPDTARALLVALSAYGDDASRRKALAAGFDHFLAKPTDPDALLALLAG